MGNGPGEEELRRLLTQQVADMCGLPPDEVDPDRPLDEHGLSSRDTVALAGYLETLLDRPLPPTLVWEYPTISRLASALARPGREEPRPAAPPRPDAGPWRGAEPADDAIAVVGLGCRFPGGAAGAIDDPEAFWSFLLDRGDGVGEVPPERWAAFDDGSPAAGEALASATRWAAVLPDVAGFDAAFFGISPGEAAAMDPQQRMLLEVSWEALEHAGIAPASLRGSRTGVFVGISAAEYAYLTTSDLSRIDAWTATGAATSIAAGRISYLLDLRGPSLAVDTACSSSLLAVHLAVTSLRRRESDVALAGGVNLLLSPVITMTFDAGGGTSPDGRCRPFDAGANGMVRGEGCGVVVLKRLADAQREGDRVLAVITATAVNSDGRSNGLVAPSSAAQRDLLRAAHGGGEAGGGAGQGQGQVDYVEAHGTGTPLGDPIEAQALGQVLGAARPATRPLLIGSVKSNIGHLEAAAGVAGLIKTVLALAHRQIPPTLHFSSPSPHIPLADLGLAVTSQATAWPGNSWPPTAGVSAFGFSGTNVHVVLAAAEDDYQVNGRQPVTPRAGTFLLSDKSAERVQAQARQLADWLACRPDEPPLTHIARTLDRRQGRGPHRSTVIARDRDELAAGLRALGAGERHPAVVSGTDGQAGPGVAFVFSGYGSQWPGMGRALAAAEPAFADALAELEQPLREATGIAGLALTGAAADDALRQVQVAQPVLFGFQVALARLWEAHGVRPVAVIGHSMGEVAAAVVSGALSVADGARVIACRSRLLTRLAGAGAMAHVGLPADEVTGLADGLPDVHLAVISSPVQCVVTGNAAQVGEVVARARARGAAARVLDAAGAGHSPQVDPLLAELTAQLADVAARPATTRFYSTAHDNPGALPRCDASYWAANLRRTVRLGPAVAAAAGDGLRTFVEVSPHPLLTRALDETVRHETGRPGVITGTLRRGADEVLAFHTQLATLAVGGHRLPRLRSGSIIDLPPAPWRHESYWADPPPRPGPAGHPLLGPHVELPAGGHAWQRQIDAETLGKPRAVRDSASFASLRHDATLFPLSAAAEMIIAAACEAWAVPCTAVQASALRLVRLLPVGTGPSLTTTLDGPAASGAARRATVRIHAQDAVGTWKLVATGHVAEDMPDARAGLGRPEQTAADAAATGSTVGTVTGGLPDVRAGRRPARADGRGAPGGEAPGLGAPGVTPRASTVSPGLAPCWTAAWTWPVPMARSRWPSASCGSAVRPRPAVTARCATSAEATADRPHGLTARPWRICGSPRNLAARRCSRRSTCCSPACPGPPSRCRTRTSSSS
jgi:phthiocerol/phenolphthiocerol synthesis type-I polyketide synthase D